MKLLADFFSQFSDKWNLHQMDFNLTWGENPEARSERPIGRFLHRTTPLSLNLSVHLIFSYPLFPNGIGPHKGPDVHFKSCISRVLYPLRDLYHLSRPAVTPQALSTYPPTWAGRPIASVYLAFQLLRFTWLPRSLPVPVGSYPTLSPLPRVDSTRGGLLSVALASPDLKSRDLPVRKQDALCCPDFPLRVRIPAAIEP